MALKNNSQVEFILKLIKNRKPSKVGGSKLAF